MVSYHDRQFLLLRGDTSRYQSENSYNRTAGGLTPPPISGPNGLYERRGVAALPEERDCFSGPSHNGVQICRGTPTQCSTSNKTRDRGAKYAGLAATIVVWPVSKDCRPMRHKQNYPSVQKCSGH
jgi:hypothetical protein